MNHLKLFTLFFLFPCWLFAQKKAAHFEKIGLEQGLSSLQTSGLLLDSRGFLWIGTSEAGVCRFDGYEMVVWRHRERDTNSLAAGNVYSLLEDGNGMIWVGTGLGVSRINPASGQIENFNRKNGKGAFANENNLFLDRKGNLWNRNQGGLEWFDTADRRFVRHPMSDSLSFVGKSAFGQDGRLWAGGAFITSIDLEANKIRQFVPSVNSFYQGKFLPTQVFIDRSEHIWAMTWGAGLCRFDPKTETFEEFRWNPLLSGYTNIVFDMVETFGPDGQRILWISTEKGIFKMPLGPDEFPSLDRPFQLTDHQSNPELPNGIQARRLLANAKGNVCFTSDRGVFCSRSGQEHLETIHEIPAGGEELVFAKNGDVLACYDGAQTFVCWKKGNAKREPGMKFLTSANHPNSARAMSLAKDEESGIVYVATLDGLWSWDEKGKKSRWFRCKGDGKKGLPFKKVSHVFPLGGGRFLLGFWKQPLAIFDAKKGECLKKIGGGSMIVRQIKRIADGSLWVCAERRLMRFNPETEDLEIVLTGENLLFFDIHMDGKGRVWAATFNGLLLLNAKNGQVLDVFGHESGLPSEEVHEICEDKLGRLWLMTTQGLCLFDPETGRAYGRGQSAELSFFDHHSLMRQSPDGRIWLNRGAEVYAFQPALLKLPEPSRCLLTGLKINGKEGLFERPFEQLGEIRLRPGQNSLTFSYTAIDLEIFGKTRFKYRLEGLSDEWVVAGKNRAAAFINLPAGAYCFRVRPDDAGDNDRWDATLRVVVTDHVWERRWFQFLAGGGLLFGVFWYRFRVVRREFALRQNALENEKKALESSNAALLARMNPHFMYNSLNSIQDFLQKNDGPAASNYLQTFASLSRQALDYSDQKTIRLEQEIAFLNDYLAVESLRMGGRLAWKITLADDVDDFDTQLPPMILQPFLENAIWHGLASKKDGNGQIDLHFKKENGGLVCTVDDNGVGLKAAAASQKNRRHESKSQSITRERLALFDLQNGTRSNFTLEELLAADGSVIGTRATLRLGQIS